MRSVLYAFVANCLLVLTVFAQDETVYIVLKPESQLIKAREFYIKDVVDLRNNKNNIGYLRGASVSREKEPINVQGGVETAFSKFVEASFPQDKLLRPVVVEVVGVGIEEKNSKTVPIEGVVKLDFTFNLVKGDSLVHLMDYQGGANYKRSSGNYAVVASAFRQAVSSAFKYFDNWMNQQVSVNIKLAKGVEVEFLDYPLRERGDTVFYHKDRRLDWGDFEAKPQPSTGYSASIFTSFAWEGNPEVRDGIIHLKLITKVFMLKSSSWAKTSTKNSYGLNHEQRHFDITKIIVERFKERVKEEQLSPDNYDGRIGYLYIETYRNMNKMQEEYDEETSNGKNREAQTRWNKLIDEELAKYLE